MDGFGHGRGRHGGKGSTESDDAIPTTLNITVPA